MENQLSRLQWLRIHPTYLGSEDSHHCGEISADCIPGWDLPAQASLTCHCLTFKGLYSTEGSTDHQLGNLWISEFNSNILFVVSWTWKMYGEAGNSKSSKCCIFVMFVLYKISTNITY